MNSRPLYQLYEFHLSPTLRAHCYLGPPSADSAAIWGRPARSSRHTSVSLQMLHAFGLKPPRKSYFKSSDIRPVACNLSTSSRVFWQELCTSCHCVIQASFLHAGVIWGDPFPIRLASPSQSLRNYNQMCCFPPCKKCQVTCQESEVLNKPISRRNSSH